jgi:AraC-like DNA-binding protein
MEAMFAVHRQKFGLNGAPYQSFEPLFQSGFDRFIRATQPAFERQAPALLISVIAEAVAFLGESQGESFLAPTPLGLPQTIQEIINLVREAPDQPWPLKLASDHVGYSPFHFSRTFKQLTGYGFHEFVDRTRTEFAVELLCSTEEPIDSVSVTAGFGTSQGMRESMREYLGLVPSEVRAEPEESLIS